MMRVVLIYLGRRGGGARYSIELAKALARKVSLLAVISRQSDIILEWRSSNLDVIEIDTYRSIPELLLSTMNVNKFNYLRSQIYSFHPHVIYYPMLHIWTPVVNLFLRSLPKVVTLHDPLPRKGEHNVIWNGIQYLSVKQADRIIVLSESLRLATSRRYRVAISQIDVIPHGHFLFYSRTAFGAARRANRPPTLLFFGRITEYKGIDVLLDAFRIVRTKVPGARLLVVGRGDLSRYKSALINCGEVTVVNRWVDDTEVPNFFEQADVVVLPYLDASQSGVIPLAYAFGLPVVATKVGGIPEQVDDGVTGLLVEPGDPVQLAEACVKLLRNPEVATQMGLAGQEKAAKEWDWDVVADRVVETLRRACEAK